MSERRTSPVELLWDLVFVFAKLAAAAALGALFLLGGGLSVLGAMVAVTLVLATLCASESMEASR